MALFSGSIRSQALNMDTGLRVILPYDRPIEHQPSPCKVLYLFHGLQNNCDAWCRYTNVERYARDKGLAVVMPEVQRSFYADMKMGLRYFTYVSQELPELCTKMFQLSTRREDTFVAGLSMGGYGALRCALTYPDHYAAAASFSGALDLKWLSNNLLDTQDMDELRGIFGSELQLEPEADILHLAKQVSCLPEDRQPRLFVTCGRQDYLYEVNCKVRDYFSALPLPFRWEEWDGTHEWDFWDCSIARSIVDFF